MILSKSSVIALFTYIFSWSFLCLQKLCAMNVEKVFFLNRDHKNGERQTDSPFLWSLFRKETFPTFIAHKFWRHENNQQQICINKAISLSIDKIKPNPAIDQNVHCLLVEPYWKSPLCCRRLGEVSVNSDVQLDSCTWIIQGGFLFWRVVLF